MNDLEIEDLEERESDGAGDGLSDLESARPPSLPSQLNNSPPSASQTERRASRQTVVAIRAKRATVISFNDTNAARDRDRDSRERLGSSSPEQKQGGSPLGSPHGSPKSTLASSPPASTGGRKMTRRQIVKQKSLITPVSVQKEIIGYKQKSKFDVCNMAYCEEIKEVLDILTRWWSVGYLKVFLLWTTWMTTGTVLYAVTNDLGWAKGFYMMVNVGYSIGW
jgi:hypothetical protein